MRNYKTCRRISARLEVLLFSDGEQGDTDPVTAGTTSLLPSFTQHALVAQHTGDGGGAGQGSLGRHAVAQLDLKRNVESCFVGMGILLGALATPELYNVGAEMVLSQGRVHDKLDSVRRLFDATPATQEAGSRSLQDSPSLEELSHGGGFV